MYFYIVRDFEWYYVLSHKKQFTHKEFEEMCKEAHCIEEDYFYDKLENVKNFLKKKYNFEELNYTSYQYVVDTF